MKSIHYYVFANLIKAFKNRKYETFVLSIMNVSKTIFPNSYSKLEKQSHGECDFIDNITGEKYDAKLPFCSGQVKLLTSGKRHKPYNEKFFGELIDESSEFQPSNVQAGDFDITATKLYKIMKELILKDKDDENIIFFFPFPIVSSFPGSVFEQFATDFLKAIYNKLSTEIDLSKRSIYTIYPSAEKNVFAVRNLKDPFIEFIASASYAKYFTHEVIGIK